MVFGSGNIPVTAAFFVTEKAPKFTISGVKLLIVAKSSSH